MLPLKADSTCLHRILLRDAVSIFSFNRITQLTSNVNLEVLNSKGFLKVFEKANEVICNLLLGCRCRLSKGISSADRLLYPISMFRMRLSSSVLHNLSIDYVSSHLEGDYSQLLKTTFSASGELILNIARNSSRPVPSLGTWGKCPSVHAQSVKTKQKCAIQCGLLTKACLSY